MSENSPTFPLGLKENEITTETTPQSPDEVTFTEHLSCENQDTNGVMSNIDNVDISVFPVLQSPETRRPRFHARSTRDGERSHTPSRYDGQHGQAPRGHDGGHGQSLSRQDGGQDQSAYSRQQVQPRSQTRRTINAGFIRRHPVTSPTPPLSPERQEIRSPLPSTSDDEYVVFPDNGWPQGVDPNLYQYDDSRSGNRPSRSPPSPTARRWDYISKLTDQQNKFNQTKKVAVNIGQRYRSLKKRTLFGRRARFYRPLDSFHLSLESIEECPAIPPRRRLRRLASRILQYASIPLRKVQKLFMRCCCPDIDVIPIWPVV